MVYKTECQIISSIEENSKLVFGAWIYSLNGQMVVSLVITRIVSIEHKVYSINSFSFSVRSLLCGKPAFRDLGTHFTVLW